MPQNWKGRSLTFDQYLAGADMNTRTMKANFDDTVVSGEDHVYFASLTSSFEPGAIKVLAISESWCGDCVENLPVAAKLASSYQCFELSVFSRDDNLDIMDKYLTNGKRTIPIFVFFNSIGTEIGRFVERPKKATEFLEAEMRKVKELPEEERKRAIYGVRTKLRKLYKSGLRDETIREIRELLQVKYGPQNT